MQILIAEDSASARRVLQRGVEALGHECLVAEDGTRAWELFRGGSVEVVISDWMMPGLDGLELARRLRAIDGIPILMLTARDAVEDRVMGLDSGADDYLVKPFATAELLARVRALLRRTVHERPAEESRALVYADLWLDPTTRETRRGEREFTLSPKEFDLLAYLMKHPKHVLSRARILEEVWGYDFARDDNVLDVYIGYLRSKTEAGGEPRLIHTVRGVGYVLRDN